MSRFLYWYYGKMAEAPRPGHPPEYYKRRQDALVSVETQGELKVGRPLQLKKKGDGGER